MIWRIICKYIVICIVMTPILFESYTFAIYHGMYVGGHTTDPTYYTYGQNPVLFVATTAVYAFLCIPIISCVILTILADLGLVSRNPFYVSKDDKVAPR